MTRAFAPAAVVLAMGVGGLALCSHRESPEQRNLAVVAREAFEVRVETVGSLDAARGFHVASGLRGDSGKIVQVADDGAQVRKDDLLVRFDPSAIEANVVRLGGELRSREAMVEFARQNLELEKSQTHKTLDNGEYDLHAARQEHGRYQAYIDDLRALERKGFPMAAEVAQARRKAEQLETQLRKHETELTRLQRQAVHKIAQAAAELSKAENEAATTRASLAAARDELSRTEVRAPMAGFVVLAETFQGTTKRRPRAGDTVWQGQSVLYLPDLSSMVVKTQVREEDLHKVRPGQKAAVLVDAYPDARFEGEIASVGVLASDTAGTAVAGKHFGVVIALSGNDSRLRPGMTARATIIADRVRDAVVVPLAALHYEAGQPTCYVFDGRGLVGRRVRPGRRGDDVVEIVEGLAAGERVSLVRP